MAKLNETPTPEMLPSGMFFWLRPLGSGPNIRSSWLSQSKMSAAFRRVTIIFSYLHFGGKTRLELLLLSSFIGQNPMSDRTRIHVGLHSLKIYVRDTRTVDL